MTAHESIALEGAFAALEFLADRTPQTTDAQAARAFSILSDYRDGGVYIGHWAGASEWERHLAGDELVLVIEGATTLFLLENGEEHALSLGANELFVVPRGTWHRFETPREVKILTVTPQPTDHRLERPS